MKPSAKFPFERARRITPGEVERARKAIEKVTGKRRPRRIGRPKKKANSKYTPISIRVHPAVLAWLKREAKRRKIGYQSLINQILFKEAA